MLSSFISIPLTMILLLMAMAFFTLMERKVLGYAQNRKGPNKVALMGLPQPLADAAKLFLKEQTKPTYSNQIPYIAAPIITLFLAMSFWAIYPSQYQPSFFTLAIMYFLCISSMNVYPTLIAGWSSNSKYALLGALRAIAQTISYEVTMALIIMAPLFLMKSFSLLSLTHHQIWMWILMIIPPILAMWFITTLAETNRAPFDFAEGESEIVSGFNVEYSAGNFALIFMAEYMNIIFMSLISATIFMGGATPFFMLNILLPLKSMFFVFLFLWVRATLPRMRYDHLMSLTWKAYLPTILLLLLFLAPVSMLVSS